MRNALAIAFVLFAALSPARGEAFDNVRKGFLLGGSTGLGAQLYSSNRPNPPGSLSEAALATSLRLGYGLDAMTEIYFFSGGVTSFQFYYIPLPYTSTVTGLGLRRYFSGSPSRAFASVGAGVGSTSIILSWKNWGNGSGLGLMGGLGYEYRKHWSLELEGDWANLAPVPPYDDPSTPISSVTMIALKISGTAY